MKKHLPMLILCSLAMSFPIAGIANRSQNTAVKKNSMVVSKGAMVEIRLQSNPTTGYSWAYTLPNNSVVKYVSNTYISDNHPEGMVGVGGTEVYKFQAIKTGKTQIQFGYRRPWEKNVPPIQTELYDITVK